jgi:hypothetical protein
MQLISLGDGDISGGGVGTNPAIGSLKAKGTHSRTTGLINKITGRSCKYRAGISPFATMIKNKLMFFLVLIFNTVHVQKL